MDERKAEGQTEILDLTQLVRALTGEEVVGTPMAEIAYPVEKREQEPGQELLNQRVRVSFDFDVRCDSGPVANMSYDNGGTMSMALLKSFLVVNKGKLMDMMVDCIGRKLGYHPESFMSDFLPQINVECTELFSPAIEALEGDEGKYWREVRDEPWAEQWGDYLTVCTDEIFECFSAEFISSSYEVIEQIQQGDKSSPRN